jgi:ribosome biogenesis GTPase
MHDSLRQWGWDDSWEEAFAPLAETGLTAARVLREDRGAWLVTDGQREWAAGPSGRLRDSVRGAHELPAVGDWVALQLEDGGATALVWEVLPRRSAFSRKASGKRDVEQVVAANVDVVLVMAGLDGDLNVRRLERYLAATWQSGARPVVLLNKADLCSDLDAALAEVAVVASGAPVHVLSALEGVGLACVHRYLAPGVTLALLGSSGVGKSTLLNALLSAQVQDTAAVRESDNRGRHTTTRRELFALPGGALVIDTPGMRELHLWRAHGGLAQAFPEVAEVAQGCRFNDCRHVSEPGCAVRAAQDAGELDGARVASYSKLKAELEAIEARKRPSGRGKGRGPRR